MKDVYIAEMAAASVGVKMPPITTTMSWMPQIASLNAHQRPPQIARRMRG